MTNPISNESPIDAESSEPIESSETLENEAPMTAEQLAEAKEYGRKSLICDLVSRAIDIGFFVGMALVLGGQDGWLMRVVPGPELSDTMRLVCLVLILVGLNMLVSLPLSYYSGHVLEHRYGLSHQSLAAWFWRYAKRNFLEIAFAVVLIPGIYWLIWLTGPWWWLVAAVAFFMLSVVMGQLAPVLILPLFYKIERLDQSEQSNELNHRMARLAEGTGLSIDGVYRMDMSSETAKANAMLTGLGRTRRVILGDTVLQHFTPDEIEVIFAHEIGHHVHRHIRKMIVTGAIYSTLGFWCCDWLMGAWIRHQGSTVDYAQFPIYTLPMFLLIITLFSLVLEPLQNSISRHYERQADRYALQRTGMTDAYVSAFQKLAKLNKDDPAPNRLEVVLFHSHPPITERLAMAESFP